MQKKEVWIGKFRYQITLLFSAPILIGLLLLLLLSLSFLALVPIIIFYFTYLCFVVNGAQFLDSKVICYNFYDPWRFKKIFNYEELESYEFVKNRYLIKSGFLFGYTFQLTFAKKDSRKYKFCYFVSQYKKDEVVAFLSERLD